MYNLAVRDHFEAAHALRGYPGKCAQVHGHRWEIEAVFICESLDEIGMGVDFGILKLSLGLIIERFDHGMLNEIPPFDKINPTAENIASHFFQELKKTVEIARIKKVKVWESPESWASYCEDGGS